MKYVLIIVFGLASYGCFAQTQTEMNQEAWDSYSKVDSTLNKVYYQILDEYKTDTIFIQNLKAAQRIWIKFRDAELAMKYPERGPAYYGTIHPLCVAMYLEQLTQERIKTLKAWLEGGLDGDACNGSIKF